MLGYRNGIREMKREEHGMVLLHNVDAHNVNVTGRVCYLM
jgi:hypothetical protein